MDWRRVGQYAAVVGLCTTLLVSGLAVPSRAAADDLCEDCPWCCILGAAAVIVVGIAILSEEAWWNDSSQWDGRGIRDFEVTALYACREGELDASRKILERGKEYVGSHGSGSYKTIGNLESKRACVADSSSNSCGFCFPDSIHAWLNNYGVPE
jgi:hypothetical protein